MVRGNATINRIQQWNEQLEDVSNQGYTVNAPLPPGLAETGFATHTHPVQQHLKLLVLSDSE